MPTLANLQRYRQLRSEPRTNSNGDKYLALESLWRKPDSKLEPMGWFVLYPNSAEQILKQLEEFQVSFSSSGAALGTLAGKTAAEGWRKGPRRGGLFLHAEEFYGRKHVVITFQPPKANQYSSVRIDAADIPAVVSFIRSELAALAAPVPPATPVGSSVPVPSSLFLDPSETEDRCYGDNPEAEAELEREEQERALQEERESEEIADKAEEWSEREAEAEEIFREKKEDYSRSIEEAFRSGEEGWAYSDDE